MANRIFGFEEFERDLEIVKRRFPEEIEKFLIEIANRGLRKVKKRTPVGVYTNGNTGGNLRRNWKVSDVKRNGDRLSIELYNNVEYAPYVELGHRTRNGGFVPGVYMLEMSIMELERELPKHVYALLREVLGKL
ncbi:HK97 gp10 family phage protein [Bacillus massiliigorillae]|uniref:HK97 gp10 family phage protein n=1 Tax=Bacillus massiliigorillae TaxID=1243664 RepID=UPI0003A89509|nr:HK97 gp10 family phage protein [Bacillus massiliigorillae]